MIENNTETVEQSTPSENNQEDEGLQDDNPISETETSDPAPNEHQEEIEQSVNPPDKDPAPYPPLPVNPVPTPEIPKPVQSESPKTIKLELLQTDIESLNHRRFAKFAIIDALKHFRHDQNLPMARKNQSYNSKDIYYLRKSQLHYDEKTGIFSVEVPVDIINMAPGFYAVPTVQVIHSHDVFNDKKERVRVITQLIFHEISLIQEDNAYPNLNSRLMLPEASK